MALNQNNWLYYTGSDHNSDIRAGRLHTIVLNCLDWVISAHFLQNFLLCHNSYASVTNMFNVSLLLIIKWTIKRSKTRVSLQLLYNSLYYYVMDLYDDTMLSLCLPLLGPVCASCKRYNFCFICCLHVTDGCSEI